MGKLIKSPARLGSERSSSRHLTSSERRAMGWVNANHYFTRHQGQELGALIVSRSVKYTPEDEINSRLAQIEEFYPDAKRHKLPKTSLINPREGRQFLSSFNTDLTETAQSLKAVCEEFPSTIVAHAQKAIILGRTDDKSGLRHVGLLLDTLAQQQIQRETTALKASVGIPQVPRVPHISLFLTDHRSVAQDIVDQLNDSGLASFSLELDRAEVSTIPYRQPILG